MNVIIGIPCLNRGGTEVQTLNLVRVLISEGYEVSTLCYFEYEKDVVLEYEQSGSKVILLKLIRDINPIKLILILKQHFKHLKPDIVHVQYMNPGAIPILAAKLAGINKILATVHQPYTANHGKLAKFLLRASARLCTRFIAVSKNAEISWFGTGSFYNIDLTLQQQSQHFSIHNAVDTKHINQLKLTTNIFTERNKLGIKSDSVIIGAVSRLQDEKGIDVLIDAYSLILKENSNTHLLIVGSGPDEDKLKLKASKLNINDKCTFYGLANWDKAMSLLAIMDIVVVPSRFEGFGLTAVEAMSMSKPVIASDVFGLSEVINHKTTGLLYPVGDANYLSKHLLNLITNIDFQKEISMNAKIDVENKFDISIFATKINHLYNEIYKW